MPEAAKVGSLPPASTSSVRRSLRVTVDMQVQVFASNMTCCGRGHELGVVGMAIHVPLEVAVGETVRLMFQPPGSRLRFGVPAIVRNREGFRYGVEFGDLGAIERDELERVLRNLAATSAN